MGHGPSHHYILPTLLQWPVASAWPSLAVLQSIFNTGTQNGSFKSLVWLYFFPSENSPLVLHPIQIKNQSPCIVPQAPTLTDPPTSPLATLPFVPFALVADFFTNPSTL